jgi:AcrR family transcriptional regulator
MNGRPVEPRSRKSAAERTGKAGDDRAGRTDAGERARRTSASGTRRSTAKRAVTSTTGGAPAQERKLRDQGKKTLRKLLDAAVIVFERRGYHAARVDDIVKVAKTSHGTFYLYFANKEDLFRALLADVTNEMTLLSESLGSISPSKAGYDELRGWLARFFDLHRRYHPVIRAWTESETSDRELGRLGASVLGGMTRTLAVSISSVEPPVAADPRVAALAMVALIERFSYYVISRNLDVDAEVALDTLAGLLHVGLYGGARRKLK